MLAATMLPENQTKKALIDGECVEYFRRVDGKTISGEKLISAVLVITASIEDDDVLEPGVYEYVFEIAPMSDLEIRMHINNIRNNVTPERWNRVVNGLATDPEKRGYVGRHGYNKDYTAPMTGTPLGFAGSLTKSVSS